MFRAEGRLQPPSKSASSPPDIRRARRTQKVEIIGGDARIRGDNRSSELAVLNDEPLASDPAKSPHGLDGWLARGPGALLRRREMQIASDLISNLFGYHLVLVGPAAYVPLLVRSRVLHSSVIVPPNGNGEDFTELPADCPYPVLRAEAGGLPLASDSVDVVLLPHVLEFARDAHVALREAERVLVGEGHLVLMGFNPVGAMGLWRTCLKRKSVAPWNGAFFSTPRIKDWLALLGFDVLAVQSAFFRPPFENRRLLARLGFLETAGERLWPYLGGTYVILAKKRLTTITPVRARWRPRRRLVSVGVAEPSSRSAAEFAGLEPSAKSAKRRRPHLTLVRG